MYKALIVSENHYKALKAPDFNERFNDEVLRGKRRILLFEPNWKTYILIQSRSYTTSHNTLVV